MGSNLELHGVYVPLVTPFGADDKPVFAEVEKLAEESIEAGASGLVVLGTTGEPATLSADERRGIVDVVAGVCRRRSVQLMVGVGTNSTAASVAALAEVRDVEGVTAVLSVVPYYTRPLETGVVEHFKQMADSSTVPIVVYNVPYRTGRGLGAESLLQLAAHPNVAGVKQAVGSIDADTLRLMADKPADFHVLCGDDSYLYSLMCLGASGAIAASSHLRTADFVSLVDLCRKGELIQARDIANALLPLCEALFAEPNPSVVKGVLAAQGRISTPALRLPMTAASRSAVDAALAAFGH